MVEPGSPRKRKQQHSKQLAQIIPRLFLTDSKNLICTKMTSLQRTFERSSTKTISKADLSFNWREPLPALSAKAATKILPPTSFRSHAWAKKQEPVVNPFPSGPWYDFTEYRVGLKCELCKTTIRKSVSPQETQCGHVFCAKCIHTHYYLERNKKCPCCAKYIEEEDDPLYCHTCWSTPCDCDRYDREDDDDGCCPGCGDRCCNGHCDDEPNCPSCGPGCDGTCGALSCGCIDVCRGRCDSEEYCGGW